MTNLATPPYGGDSRPLRCNAERSHARKFSMTQLATQPDIQCEGLSNALLKLLGGQLWGQLEDQVDEKPIESVGL